MNRLLQRFYAWLLPIGPLRLGWEQRDRTRYFLRELLLQGQVRVADAAGGTTTYGYLPIPPRPVPVDDPAPPYTGTFMRGVLVKEPTADELRLAAELQAMFHRIGMHADGLRAVIIPPTDDRE